MTNIYFGGRNYDGTGFSPLYYNDYYTTQNNGNYVQGQMRFLNPYSANGAAPLIMNASAPVTTTSCSGVTTTLYPVAGLYVAVDMETGRMFVTNGGSSPPDPRYNPAYIGEVNDQLVIMMSETTNPTYTSTYTHYAQAIDSDYYITATLQTTQQCPEQKYVGGTPVVADGIVWLTDPNNVTKFYTTAVNGPSFYAMTPNTIPSGLQNGVASIPSGYTAELYMESLLGIIPNPTTAVSTTPAASVNSSGLTPAQVAAIRKKSQTISTWSMIGAGILLLVIAIIIIIIFMVTQPKHYPHNVPVMYDENKRRVYDLPVSQSTSTTQQNSTQSRSGTMNRTPQRVAPLGTSQRQRLPPPLR